ncbi:hypothetical protein [Arthrobacter sp. Helios]|uniref:hypothetical protein n=1 Tax=Arthrobacter sp. Helios TaxID=2828862 RepID=UPI00204D8DC6|nr:hypothetical protein [Arthrobacter sp. Helios]UPO77049.1 hypothetical protein ArtHe_17285 [Arthrobacter sp. Helios]
MITDGPYSETVEQISGYNLVDVPDLDSLPDACVLLADSSPVEVRALVSTEAGSGSPGKTVPIRP